MKIYLIHVFYIKNKNNNNNIFFLKKKIEFMDDTRLPHFGSRIALPGVKGQLLLLTASANR
jgi:hypothetical protein